MNALLFSICFLIGDVDRPSPAQQICIACELMDVRESRYILRRLEDLPADNVLLCNRSADLADAPRVSEAERFPSRHECNELLAVNRAYRQHLNVQKDMRPHIFWRYQEAIADTDRLYQIWDMVRDARCEYYYVTVRRFALVKLREAIGWEQFYAGWMPPHVPLANFREVR